jgi:hypothetical protein
MPRWPLMLSLLVLLPAAAARAGVVEATSCWLSLGATAAEPVICMAPRHDGQMLAFGSMRALHEAGWTITEIAGDRRFGEQGVRLAVERYSAARPLPYRRMIAYLPPP